MSRRWWIGGYQKKSYSGQAGLHKEPNIEKYQDVLMKMHKMCIGISIQYWKFLDYQLSTSMDSYSMILDIL